MHSLVSKSTTPREGIVYQQLDRTSPEVHADPHLPRTVRGPSGCVGLVEPTNEREVEPCRLSESCLCESRGLGERFQIVPLKR